MALRTRIDLISSPNFGRASSHGSSLLYR